MAVTLTTIPIIDPINQNLPAMLVIYDNKSRKDASFKALMNDGDHIESMDFTLPSHTKTSWVWRPLTDKPQFEVMEFDIHNHNDGNFDSDGIIDSQFEPNLNI